jgi:hypothetical protein
VSLSRRLYSQLEQGRIHSLQAQLAGQVIRASLSTDKHLEGGVFEQLQTRLGHGVRQVSRSSFGRVELGVFDQAQRKAASGLTLLSRRVFRWLETGVIDRLQRLLAVRLREAGQSARKTQTGILSYNMLYMQIGLLILLLIFGGVILWPR